MVENLVEAVGVEDLVKVAEDIVKDAFAVEEHDVVVAEGKEEEDQL